MKERNGRTIFSSAVASLAGREEHVKPRASIGGEFLWLHGLMSIDYGIGFGNQVAWMVRWLGSDFPIWPAKDLSKEVSGDHRRESKLIRHLEREPTADGRRPSRVQGAPCRATSPCRESMGRLLVGWPVGWLVGWF